MGVASKYPSNQKEINEMNRDCFYPSRLLIQEFGKKCGQTYFFTNPTLNFSKQK